MSKLLEVEKLRKYFPVKKKLFSRESQWVHAVDGVSFEIKKNETLGLAGESGCGKTTIGRVILGLTKPTAGKVRFSGNDIFNLSKAELNNYWRVVQMIFQDPLQSLNPRKTIRHILGQPYRLQHIGSKDEILNNVIEILEIVGLVPGQFYLDRFPHEFSGGQRQRIGIARAVALHPKFIVADEPVSALDVSVRAQILNLMKELQRKFQLSYLFITHDLAIIRSMSDRVAIMYLGEIVEMTDVEELFNNPLHPYTKALISAIPIPNPKKAHNSKKIILKGEIPSSINPPAGCRFHTRCPHKKTQCTKIKPKIMDAGNSHLVACHEII